MTEQQLQQELEALRAENKFLKAQNAAISKELDDYIQKLSKPEFEELIEKEQSLDELMNDEYFEGLTLAQIAQLAKKTIKLCAESRELEDKLTKQNKLIEELSDLMDDLMLETITTRDGETYDIYTCSELTYNLINKTIKTLMED